ncbi:MAG: ABC transporter permease [Thermomicrobiales bacterium]|nr:ABC transporter permease [Thermomicrobiales bacterium]MCO5221441.1 ABC transporter permease [Thermomicrobiales bacterium]
MSRFLIRRLLGAIPLLFGVAVISFMLMQVAPGGPDATYARSPRMTDERLQALREKMGLDQSIPVQFVKWIQNLLRGDLGSSYVQNRPVTQVIQDAFPNTLLLVTVGLILALVFALLFGVLAAVNPYGWFDNVTALISYFGLAMPVFWFGLMLQILFSVKLGWLPSSGLHDPQNPGVLDTLEHLVLPAVTLAIGSIAVWSRYIRSSTIETLQHDYVRTARAKGLSDRSVLSRHVLRNSLTSFITVAAIDIPLYLTGVVFIETVFSLPGMGRLFYDSLTRRDYPVLMGILMFSATLIIIGNLIADLIYAKLDPRVSFE